MKQGNSKLIFTKFLTKLKKLYPIGVVHCNKKKNNCSVSGQRSHFNIKLNFKI